MKIVIIIITLLLFNHADGQIITTVAGGGHGGDGVPATASSLSDPVSIIIDRIGNIYFSEELGCRIRIIDTSGVIHNFAGNGTSGYSGDGGPASAAEFNEPIGIAFDSLGNIFVGDAGNNVVRKIDIVTQIITTICGNGTSGFSGDGGPAFAALLRGSGDVKFDRYGNLLIGCVGCIRKINGSGIISTVAGVGTSWGYSGDGGTATVAEIEISNFCLDSNNNIYLTEPFSYDVVRKIDGLTSIITTIAGDSGSYIYNGNGLDAHLTNMDDEWSTIGHDNRFYYSDRINNIVRVLDTNGHIYTIAGNTGDSTSGDGGPATAAAIYGPTGLTFDSCGNLFVASINDGRIRKVTFLPNITNSIAATTSDTVCATTAVTYSATVMGSGAFTYKWYVNAIATTGTGSSYTYTPANGDSVMCVGIATSACYSADTVSSNTIHMVVNPTTTPTLTLTAFPNDTVCAGTPVTYSVTGGATLYQWVVNGSAVSGSTGSSYTYTPANGDSIRCTVPASGCNMGGSSNEIDMVVMPYITPTITITASPTAAAVGSVVTVTATFTGAGSSYTITWYDNGSFLAISTVPTITYTKTSDTDHITATILPAVAYPDCYDSAVSNVVLVRDSSLGVPPSPALPRKQGREVLVYPNPAGGVVHVDELSEDAAYTLTNMLGQVVQRGVLKKGNNILSLTNVISGVYMLHITNEQESGVYRVMKE